MTHKWLKLNGLLGIVTLVLAASAAQADGFAIGMSGARAPLDIQEAGITGDASGWRVFGSYMFNRNFGVEVGMSQFGSPGGRSIPTDMHVDTEVFDVFAVVAYPIGEDLGLIGKVGYATWNTETEVNDENETHYKSRDLGLSFGGQYDISERFAIRGEAEWFQSFASGELKYSLSGVFRFQ